MMNERMTMKTMKNVLVCEDDPVQLKVLTTLINQAGYRPVSARTPSEAVVAARRCGVDAVLTDVQLQDGNAFDLIGDLRRSGVDAPVLMASAYATDGMKDRAREAGAKFFFEKPFDLPKIREQVDRVLQAQRNLHAVALIVESHPQVRADFEKTVSAAGFTVLTAKDGAEALYTLANGDRRVDIMLTDLHVDGAAGANLIAKAMVCCPELHVVMMSGDANRDEIRAGYEAGAASLLRKPIAGERLQSFLIESLKLARATQEQAAVARRRAAQYASKPITQRFVIDAKNFSKSHKAKNGFAFAAVAAAALLIGAVSALAARSGFEAADRMEKMTDRLMQLTTSPAMLMNHESPSTRWQAGEQLRLMGEANQMTRNYYEGQIREMRFQNRPQVQGPQAPAPVMPSPEQFTTLKK
jgi:DNA-binding NtrC family response regulator